LFNQRKATTWTLGSKGARVPPGSKGRACRHGGSPGTWEALSPLSEKLPGRGSRKPNPGSFMVGVPVPTMRAKEALRYLRVKATKPEEMDGRESERHSDGTFGGKDAGNIET